MLSYKTLTSFKTCPIVPVQDPFVKRIPACPSGGSSNEYLVVKFKHITMRAKNYFFEFIFCNV